MAAMDVLECVGKFARSRKQKVFYLFEKGDRNQNILNRMLERVSDDAVLTSRYAYENHACIPKGHSEASALMCADLLAWEWQQNLGVAARAEREGSDPGQWSDNLKTICGDVGYLRHMSVESMHIRAMANAFHGIG